MGERTNGVKTSPEVLEREVESIREGMTPILSELDHRRHDLTDWRLQLRRRGPALLKAFGVLAGLLAVVQIVKRQGRTRRARRATASSSIF
jgi:hypothetical protein